MYDTDTTHMLVDGRCVIDFTGCMGVGFESECTNTVYLAQTGLF